MLPAVPSTTVPPGFSKPAKSEAQIKRLAFRINCALHVCSRLLCKWETTVSFHAPAFLASFLVQITDLYRISVINSPGSYFFKTTLEGELLFQSQLFTSDKTKFRSKWCKIIKALWSKNEPYSLHDELPGELFEGGSYFFDVGAKRGGGGGVIERRSYLRGELFKEIQYLVRQPLQKTYRPTLFFCIFDQKECCSIFDRSSRIHKLRFAKNVTTWTAEMSHYTKVDLPRTPSHILLSFFINRLVTDKRQQVHGKCPVTKIIRSTNRCSVSKRNNLHLNAVNSCMINTPWRCWSYGNKIIFEEKYIAASILGLREGNQNQLTSVLTYSPGTKNWQYTTFRSRVHAN